MASPTSPRALSDDEGLPYISALPRDGKGDVRTSDPEARLQERALIERAKAGDREAFGDLYRSYRPSVYRLAWFRAGEASAEDVVAETFTRAWSSLPRYQDVGSPFSAWLYAIARHVAIDAVRRRVRDEPRAELPDRGVESGVDDRLELAEAIAKLPEDQRTVIEMKYFVGLTNDEVAALMDRSPGAINALQHRAHEALRALVDGGEVDA